MILITGGAGFIGSHFARLKAKTDKICILDKLNYAANLENIEDLPNIEFIKGDITDFELVKGLIEKRNIKTIVNFAAESHVDRSIESSLDFSRTNILGTHVLLEIARLFGLRFHQVSTDEVYGDIEGDKKSLETDSLWPRSPYSSSKAAADLLTYSYHITYGLFITISRGANTVGPFQYPEKALPLFTTNAMLDLPIPIYGDGLQIREYTDVLDHCLAIDLILDKGRPGEIYNISSGDGLTNLEMAKIIINELKKPEDLIHFITDRPGHDRRYAVDTTKLSSLGWEPKMNAKEAIKKAVHWYMNNISWWQKIRESEIFKKDYEKRYIKRGQI